MTTADIPLRDWVPDKPVHGASRSPLCSADMAGQLHCVSPGTNFQNYSLYWRCYMVYALGHWLDNLWQQHLNIYTYIHIYHIYILMLYLNFENLWQQRGVTTWRDFLSLPPPKSSTLNPTRGTDFWKNAAATPGGHLERLLASAADQRVPMV